MTLWGQKFVCSSTFVNRTNLSSLSSQLFRQSLIKLFNNLMRDHAEAPPTVTKNRQCVGGWCAHFHGNKTCIVK